MVPTSGSYPPSTLHVPGLVKTPAKDLERRRKARLAQLAEGRCGVVGCVRRHAPNRKRCQFHLDLAKDQARQRRLYGPNSFYDL